MATPRQLVEAMALSLDIPVATVIQYDRQLAENGLRSKSGRGTSAAAVTARDAANLLIAVAASPLAGPTVKEAVRTCEAYGSLKALQRASWVAKFPKFGLPALASLPVAHSLREALSVLIDGVGKGEIFQLPHMSGRARDSGFLVRFDGPEPWAEIFAYDPVEEATSQTAKEISQSARIVYTSGIRKKGWGPDLIQTRRISFATIRALGSLISRAKCAKSHIHAG
jgi:hypothetical protein